MLSGFRPLAMLIVIVALPAHVLSSVLAAVSLFVMFLIPWSYPIAMRLPFATLASFGAVVLALASMDRNATRKLGLVMAALICLALTIALLVQCATGPRGPGFGFG